MKVSDLITDAFTDIRVARAGESLEPENLALGLLRLNGLLDQWNADDVSVWARQFVTFTLLANHQPHTIGPSGADWTLPTVRPQGLLGASVLIGTGTPIPYLPLNIRDADWWQNNLVPTITNAFPTDVYYSPDWTQDGSPDNGSLYFWPVATTAYDVRLELAVALAQVAATDTVLLPPGYRRALTKTLAEDLAEACGQPASPKLQQDAAHGRALIYSVNRVIPRVATQDAGMPSGGLRRGSDWNWRFGPLSGL